MAKKKNNKKGNRGGSSPKKNIEKQVQVTEITPEQVNVAEDFAANEMPPEANDIPESDLPDTREDEQKVETLQRTGNVEQYVNFLRDKLKRIKALEDRAEKIKNDYLDEQKKIADERRDFEDKKKEEEAKLESDRKDLNIRQKKIDEDRLAIDNGEYTKIIQSLLDTLRKTEVEITDSTRKLVEDLGKKHGDYTKALEENKLYSVDKSRWERDMKYVFDGIFITLAEELDGTIEGIAEDGVQTWVREGELVVPTDPKKKAKYLKKNKSFTDFDSFDN